jgi:fructan beta-fructosidase
MKKDYCLFWKRLLFVGLVGSAAVSFAQSTAGGKQFELLFENSDFECGDLRNWTAEGDAFDVQPIQGDNSALRNKPAEPQGTYWIGSYDSYNGRQGKPGDVQGDSKTGTLRSVDFVLKKKFVNFMAGGGSRPNDCSVELWVDGQLFSAKTGGNAETLELSSVDVSSVVGKTAAIVIKDAGGGSWGHINADWFSASDVALSDAVVFSKTLRIDGKYLLVPVQSDADSRRSGQILQLVQDGKKLREFRVLLPENGEAADWMAFYPVDEFRGETVTVKSVSALPGKYADAAGQIALSDTIPDSAGDYQLPYRDQFHFSTRRGWNNDVNGLVYHDGVYHLYYQYNPFNIGWDNMHWGHTASTDLVHWTEHDIALFQNGIDDMMFSGGGFMDNGNTSGVSKDGTVAQFAAFTSTGRGECLAYSLDGGMSFTELPENPVVKHRGRDPKVIWHEPTHKWIMVLFDYTDEIVEPLPLDNIPENKLHNSVAFYSSADLRTWTFESRFIHADRNAIHECPELFEIAVEGQPEQTRWIYYGVENRYFIGQFDGHRFVPESGPFVGEDGIGRAAQLVSDAPDGRIIQMAWARHGFYQGLWPDQRFSQGFLVPKEVTLRETPDGLRLFFYPVKELDSLRGKQLASIRNPSLGEASRILKEQAGKLLDVVIHCTLESGAELTLTVNGQAVSASASGSLRVLSDRTITEAFVNEGATAQAFRREEKSFDDRSCGLTLSGAGQITELTVYELNSIWNEQ